ncbi:MAG: formate C-acetyltransferase [Cellulomonas sp. 73-92]|uniref:formate C-acetyltransferase n=1 Tax=Cellulomonas sp. 73-92 TaxID=1895740 RepID=UPI000928E915|nr:formate C-acetyltransferase [Cellulomonas sp. 73-92]OJV80364.1 MAG: formate C-acetyltransferase [Cellulomonas sp. 73-92]
MPSDTRSRDAVDSLPGAWLSFVGGPWVDDIDVRDFLQRNYTPYAGDASFLAGPTARTRALWATVEGLMAAERVGDYRVDVRTPSRITSHAPGYVEKDRELVVGLQTDEPLKRAIMPNGGWAAVRQALEEHGYEAPALLDEVFTTYRKTFADGVLDVYPPNVRAARSAQIVTGLPDDFGRGQIVGDYRRVPLYGVDALLAAKRLEKAALDMERSTEDVIRDREELAEQIRALADLAAMAFSYGYDISRPATTAREAVQWLYFAYLAAIKEQNGAAMSLGRTSTFLDVYLQRDLVTGRITEEEAQELVDDLVIKLRLVRFLRTAEYDELCAGEPTWVTETLGGTGEDGRPLVTKSSFRFLATLNDLGPAPEPNLTVLWSDRLPQGFKDYCAEVSLDTSAVQYESDELIRSAWGDDAAIACAVSPLRIGKQVQFVGGRVNLAKALLYAINGGRDEVTGRQVAPLSAPVEGEVLDYDDVLAKLDRTLDWLAETYVDALNCVHFMHDKYSYERLAMALHDRTVLRTLSCGVAGLSVVADSLSAIKYATVHALRTTDGLVTEFAVEGAFPSFGNDDDRVDEIAASLLHAFMTKIRRLPTYRNALHTQNVLTVTSNVSYGRVTGSTPDGRRAGEPFAPGANPMNGRDTHGMLASALSVAKLPYSDAQDGVSLTTSVTPDGLGRTREERVANLVGLLDAYMLSSGYHLNLNVLDKGTLLDAMDNPDRYPNLTIRVSGYAVNFVRLSREQQLDVLSRTFHVTV